MNLNEIYQPIQSQLAASDTLLLKELAIQDGLMGDLTRHIARMTGKRIRPALALFGAGVIAHQNRTNGATHLPAKAIRLAVAVEMIHTATLLHDDVIDGASLRRGLSTLNAKWGDTLSVLSGDYLYSKAFCLLSSLENQKVLSLMSRTAHTVCEGEVAQIQHQYDLTLSRREYLKIIEWKTASLMGAAAHSGALLAGASQAQAKRLGAFGLNFGLAFQIMDDTQDLVGDEAVLGKSLGTDLALGQMTLPLIYLRDSATPRTRTRINQWFNGNGNGNGNGSHKLLQKEAIRSQVPLYCQRVANRYLAKARTALNSFAPSPYRQSLLALTDFLLNGH